LSRGVALNHSDTTFAKANTRGTDWQTREGKILIGHTVAVVVEAITLLWLGARLWTTRIGGTNRLACLANYRADAASAGAHAGLSYHNALISIAFVSCAITIVVYAVTEFGGMPAGDGRVVTADVALVTRGQQGAGLILADPSSRTNQRCKGLGV
jgi:hypothetical protein